jgi:hypothetical protein
MMRPGGGISYAPYIPPTGTPTVVAIEAATMLEAQTRTLWMLYIGDCSASANGRPRHLSDVEMAEILLPGDEAAWQRWGGFDVTSRAIGRPAIGSRYLGIDARPIVPEEASRDGAGLGEFAHVLRIVSPFAGSIFFHGVCSLTRVPCSPPSSPTLWRCPTAVRQASRLELVTRASPCTRMP